MQVMPLLAKGVHATCASVIHTSHYYLLHVDMTFVKVHVMLDYLCVLQVQAMHPSAGNVSGASGSVHMGTLANFPVCV